MGTNLEHELGELNGQLKALVPALERQEERMRQTESRAAGAEARLEALRKEFDEYRKNTASRIGTLFTKSENAGTQIQSAKTAAEKAQADVEALKTKYEGVGKKIWDVVKIILGAVLGGLFTWWLSGRKP